MLRARRLVTSVVAAALAATGLSACNSAPGAAVYFGDVKAVSETQVQKIWDEAYDLLPADEQGKKSMPVTRAELVGLLAESATMKEVGRMQGFTAAPSDGPTLAQQLRLPQSAALVELISEVSGWLKVAQQQVKPAEPSQADLHGVYDKLAATGVYDKTFEQFASTLSADDKQGLSMRIGLRDDIAAAVDKLHITYNPRYPAPVLPLLSTTGPDNTQLPLIVVTLGSSKAGSAPVKDLA